MLDWSQCPAVEWFPGVSSEQVETVLEYAQHSLEAA